MLATRLKHSVSITHMQHLPFSFHHGVLICELGCLIHKPTSPAVGADLEEDKRCDNFVELLL